MRVKLVGDYNESLHAVWWVLSGIAGAMLLVTFFVKDIGPKGENEGFFGFGGLRDVNVARKVKITHPSARMIAILQEREDGVMKQAGWGIREVRKSEDSAFQRLMSPSTYSGATPSRYNKEYEPYRYGGDGSMYPPPERMYGRDMQDASQARSAGVSAAGSRHERFPARSGIRHERESSQKLRHDETQNLIPQSLEYTARVHLPRWPSAAAETLLHYTPERAVTLQSQEWGMPHSMIRTTSTHCMDYVKNQASTDNRGHGNTEGVMGDVLQMMRAEEEEEEQHTPTRRSGRVRLGRGMV